MEITDWDIKKDISPRVSLPAVIPCRSTKSCPLQNARITLKVAASREREEVMTLRGKLGQWIKLIAPDLVDKIAGKGIEEGK